MITRPSHVPVYGGCKLDCGHTDAEHICFDAGVYDGEHGRNDADDASIPIAEMSLPEFGAWQSGWTVGRLKWNQNGLNTETGHSYLSE